MQPLFFPHHLMPLFADVQRSGLYADSKWFTDAIPTSASEVILEEYKSEKNRDDFELREFLNKHFRFPDEHKSSYDSSQRTITEHINALWDELLREPAEAAGSLLGLPHPYIVPGGRFREVYYWDSYFTMLGLEVSGRLDIVEDMLRNFAYLIQTVGLIPNGNRSYYLGRSQPPFFALMVELLAAHKSSTEMQPFYEALEKEYKFWMKGAEELHPNEAVDRAVCMQNGTVLNRYWGSFTTPRPEAFVEDEETAKESRESPENVYRHLRAAAESGWDFSSRWQSNALKLATIETTNIIPVDLNCLLWNMEHTLAEWCKQLNRNDEAEIYFDKASARKTAIIHYCWNEERQFFTDYHFVNEAAQSQLSLAGMFPLFFNLATAKQASKCEALIRAKFLQHGGVVTTLVKTGQQWDAPNGWAPLQWITYKALLNYNLVETATEIRKRWMQLNEKVYLKTGRMMEKYNVEDLSLEAGGGEYPNQDGFGWTNGVYLKFANTSPISSLASP